MKKSAEYNRWFEEIAFDDAQCLKTLKTAISKLLRRNGIEARSPGEVGSEGGDQRCRHRLPCSIPQVQYQPFRDLFP
jgi:hypothetical protein